VHTERERDAFPGRGGLGRGLVAVTPVPGSAS